MPIYDFKMMGPVPTSNELIDIVLTRTQRRTPTVVHPGYKINRIRSFYMRKIKFTQQTIHDRLTKIITDFPRLDDIHPFYSDLCNILYDKDHYKLALGQLNTARSLTTAISRDMIRMMKYGDSAYRCKCLKRAALGRMCTLLRRLKSSLSYLKEIRLHMSRLPSIDPHERSLLLCGSPNVGKSSYMNKITRANVEVQPYAFTTQSLYVGHTDYRYLRWQVIDTPGLLDRPLEERNVIEMQAITALAHLQCSVLFLLDISEQCGTSIEDQCNLFKSIKPLFSNKQLIIIANKVDIQPYETLSQSSKDLIQSTIKDSLNVSFLTMSNITEDGISHAKSIACDRLLAARVESRVNCKHALDNVMNRLRVTKPKVSDDVPRDIFIPKSVLLATQHGHYKRSGSNMRNIDSMKGRIGYACTVMDIKLDSDRTKNNPDNDSTLSKRTSREYMWENGGPGVWAPNYCEKYDLYDPKWKFDIIPELMDGKNIMDYVDKDIGKKMNSLKEEEEQLELERNVAKMGKDDDLIFEEQVTLKAIRDKKNILRILSRSKRNHNKPSMPRSVKGRSRNILNKSSLDANEILETMKRYGVDAKSMIDRGLESHRRKNKRMRSFTYDFTRDNSGTNSVDVSQENDLKFKRRKRQKKINELKSIDDFSTSTFHRPSGTDSNFTPSVEKGIQGNSIFHATQKLERKGRKTWVVNGKSGEGDRRATVHLVKWMNTGKKRIGTHNKR